MLLVKAKPKLYVKAPEHPTRLFFFKIATSRWFDVLIMAMIGGNAILMTIKWYGMPKGLESVIEMVNYGFASVFAIEAVVKISGLGKFYFKDGWNGYKFWLAHTPYPNANN